MLININGRTKFVQRDIVLHKDRPGHWSGTVSGHQFTIEGGRAAGGSSQDWFVECPDFWNGAIHTTSLVQSVKLIDNC